MGQRLHTLRYADIPLYLLLFFKIVDFKKVFNRNPLRWLNSPLKKKALWLKRPKLRKADGSNPKLGAEGKCKILGVNRVDGRRRFILCNLQQVLNITKTRAIKQSN